MNNYDFRLTPAYCLYNRVAVLEQNGSEISFLIEEIEDSIVKSQLVRAFENHLDFVKKQESCPEKYLRESQVKFVKGNHSELKRCVSSFYESNKTSTNNIIKKIEENKKDSAAAIILLDSIIYDARKKHATDVHIENNEIRFRIAGKLVFQMEINENCATELVQRIKLVSEMNVLEKRKAQDGHFVSGKNSDEQVCVRVSTLPVIGKNYEAGYESVVLRILDSQRVPIKLENLGFNSLQLKKIQQIMTASNGLILICGPTGSGKSTTLCALLENLQFQKNNSLKIVSLEDPPEYVLENISQVKIDNRIENSFHQILAHVFRQDPDVLMLGEIRDEITAKIALQGSLTGHLVFASLHTGSVGMALFRMKNLGVDLDMLSGVLRGIILQEIGYLGSQASLIADVAVPCEDFVEKVQSAKSLDGLEKFFSHDINSDEVIKESLQLLNEHMVISKNLERKKEKVFPISNNFAGCFGKEYGKEA